MIKNPASSKIVELYDQVLHLANGRKFNLKWRSNILQYFTCGSNSVLIECVNIIPNTIEIMQLHENGKVDDTISVEEYNRSFPEEQLDFKCNCHGFTFAHGKYSITDHFVDSILEDEFNEVTDDRKIIEGDFDVVCLKETSTNSWVHSCKFQYDLFIHKEGIRKFVVHTDLSEILEIPEYKNTKTHYFKRKQRNCSGICLNAIGEPHIKPFANNNYYSN